ncbi:MAG: FTR1 family protein [Verrucomicrobia bacterium]|nr:FTR1 family protein [Verrucomicrobiota bacterium]
MLTLFVSLPLCARAAGRSDDFQQTEARVDDFALDLVSAPLPPERAEELSQIFEPLRAGVQDAAARALAQLDAALPPAAQVGAARARLQHIAALEMLRAQRAGQIADAREWRALITLPRFASGEENAVLLQTADVAQMRAPAVTKALAREYVSWQVLRARQLLDYLQLGARRDDATAAFLDLYSHEIRALTQFPAPLLVAADLPTDGAEKITRPLPALTEPFDTPDNARTLAQWRQDVESTLPNLLTEQDAARLQRLLARFVKLIPKEYRNGVNKGAILIALEYREATQFTQQAQGLVNELGPVWERDLPAAYNKRHREVVDKFEALRVAISKLAPPDKIAAQATEISDILENDFHLSARRTGDRGDVIEETALEVRAALTGSLAAAKADQWQEAESQRLDAYTAFDSEIEPRVLPRDPDLGRRVERSFLDGQPDQAGIKALLDRRAPMEELEAAYEQTLEGLDSSVKLLRTSVSPTTLGFTAFSIVSREGMEAVVVLAALMAGLRGAEQRGTRRGIAAGAWLALAATGVTFWLSLTVIQSLRQHGEKLEAVVSILAVIILLIVTNWVFHKFYWVGWNAKIRSLSKAAQNVNQQRWEFLALLGVGFLTVYREGFETALFLQSLLLEGNRAAVAVGCVGGLGAILLIGALTFRFGVKLPYRRMLVITGVLVVSIMVSFLGSTTRLFQTVGWLPVHPIPGLHLPTWTGLWLGLYPSWEGVLIPPLALVYVGGAWLWTRWQSARNQAQLAVPAAVPVEVAAKRAEPETASV